MRPSFTPTPLLTVNEVKLITGARGRKIRAWRHRGQLDTVELNGVTFYHRDQVLELRRRVRGMY